MRKKIIICSTFLEELSENWSPGLNEWLVGPGGQWINTNMWGVVKYEPSLFFRKLCDSCMSALVLSPSLQCMLFPKSSPMCARVKGRVKSTDHERTDRKPTVLSQ